MKHAELHSLVHNVADSIGSGIGILIGTYEFLDVFGDANRSPEGVIAVDLLTGTVTEGVASPTLADAVKRYRSALEELCSNAGGSVTDLREATARFWSDRLSNRTDITVQDYAGRRSTREYAGIPAKRLLIKDGLGRLRTKPAVRG